MLVPLALVLAASPPQTEGDPASLLREAGYTLVQEVRGGVAEGTLSRGSRRARVRVLRGRTYTAAMFLDPSAAALQLSTEFDVAKELPQSTLDSHGFRDGLLGPGRIVFAPSLGRTVTAYADVIVDGRSTPESARADLDRYFASVEAYARAHGGTGEPARPRDWRRAPLGDALVLNGPDPASVERLLRGWGYAPRPSEFSGRGDFLTEARVGGTDVVLSGRGAPALSVSADVVLRKGARRRDWTRAGRANARRAYPSQEGRTYVSEEIALSPPLRAGELRRRLLAFARDVKALER